MARHSGRTSSGRGRARSVGALAVATVCLASVVAAGPSAAAPKPTGPPLRIGIINSEGAPGLDFPELTEGFEAAGLYANDKLGGFGGRTVETVPCVAGGTPESSQQCAQQLVDDGVDLVMVGIDVFTDFTTLEAAGIPVVGTIPVLPGDYQQQHAVFTTGGNLSIMPAIVRIAKEDLGAKSVGLVSTDNAAGNVGLKLMTDSLDKAGIEYTVVKGGDDETDAGYQGLVRTATADGPDALISLYTGAGCTGTIRARASLGLDIPAIAIATCGTEEVLDATGDDAAGWIFGGASGEETGLVRVAKKYLAKVQGVSRKKADAGGLALVGFVALASVAEASQDLAAGGEVTGTSVFDAFATAKGRRLWGGGQPYECGQVAEYPAVCAFAIPFAVVGPGGKLKPYEGGKLVDGIPYLP